MSSFTPLIEALQKKGVPVSESDVWNTGGGVMCLGVHLTEDPEGPYAMWSDYAEYIGFGVYPDSEHPGLFVNPPEDQGDDRPQETYEWAWGDNAQKAADLAQRAIPEVVRWLTEDVTIAKERKRYSFGDYTDRKATWTKPLSIAGAQVIDFGA